MTPKESNRWRGTHKLETTEGGTRQDTKRKQLGDGVSGTHKLETTDGVTSQDTERTRPNEKLEKHSLSGDHRGNLSGHRERPNLQGALTFWRVQREW